MTSSGPADQTPRSGPDTAPPPAAATPADPDDLNLPGRSSEPEVITNPKFRIWLRADGIVQVVWALGDSMDFDDAVAVTEAMSALTGGRKSPILADARGGGPPERSSRAEFARRSDLMSAVAIVVDTPLTRTMGNFFLAVNKPVAPTRLFEDEGPAVAWLSGFLP
jgi:hypothetical protein